MMLDLFLSGQSYLGFALPEWVHQNLDQAKENVNAAVSQVETNASDLVQSAQTASQSAVDSVHLWQNRVWENVVNFPETTQEWMGNVSDRIKESGQSLTDNTLNLWTQSTEVSKAWFEGAVKNLIIFRDSVSDLAKNVILAIIPASVKSNLIILWTIAHPLLTLLILLLVLLLAWGLLKAIADLFAQVWLVVLRWPVQLVQWFFQGLRKNGSESSWENSLKIRSLGDKKRKADILDRLKSIRDEETQLLQEMETLMKLEK
jgi:hypothetical protein